MKPDVSYVICTTPRSGSHFLGEALSNTQVAGKPDEYFICDDKGRLENETGNMAGVYGRMSLEEFRDIVIDAGSTPNGVFGITIMWPYFHTILKNFRTLPQYQGSSDHELVSMLLFNPKYIWLIRRDKVRQAISLLKALQTNVWGKRAGVKSQAEGELKYNYFAIDHYRGTLAKSDRNWQQYFDDNQISPFVVVYEEFVENYDKIVREILEFLGTSTRHLRISQPRLEKQADGRSDLWAARYHRRRETLASQSILVRSIHSLMRQHFALMQYWGDVRRSK